MAKRIKPIMGRIQNVGGHLINPPRECNYRRRYSDNAIWTDLSCCNVVCKEQCEKFLWYVRASTSMRVRYLKRNGVFYPW